MFNKEYFEYFVSHSLLKKKKKKLSLKGNSDFLAIYCILFYSLASKILHKEDENHFPSHSNKDAEWDLWVNGFNRKIDVLSFKLLSYSGSD